MNYIGNRSPGDSFAEMVEEVASLLMPLDAITWLWVVLHCQDRLMLAFHLCFCNKFFLDSGVSLMQTYLTGGKEEVQIRPASTL